MSTLTLLLLLLMAMVREPQKEALPYPGALRYLIKCALAVTPIYTLIAGWALWVRIQQYGWTPERLHGVLVVVVLLAWSVGYLVSILRRGTIRLSFRERSFLAFRCWRWGCWFCCRRRLLMPGASALTAIWGCITAGKSNRIRSACICWITAENRRAALEALQKDVAFNQDSKRRRDLNSLLQGSRDPVKELTATQLVSKVVIAPGSEKPDDAFWTFVKAQGYRITSCAEQNACVLVSQDSMRMVILSRCDMLLAMGRVWSFGMQKNKWDLLAVARLPEGFNKDKLLQAVANQQLGSAPRIWRDITIDGKRLPMTYYTE
jgi:hypothetical protein